MIDQLNSHAQIGVSVTVNSSDDTCTDDLSENKNRYAEPMEGQGVLMGQVGAALGLELKKILDDKNLTPGSSTSRFCCPLDEALVECILTIPTPPSEGGKLESFKLPPYGIYPASTGRTKIGQMGTIHVQTFFDQLAKSMGVLIELNKVRGDNGHHVVESAFKAFSRALRNLLDGTSTSDDPDSAVGMDKLWGLDSASYKSGLELNRSGIIERKTKETSISVDLKMDGMKNGIKVETGIQTLNAFLSTLAKEAQMSLNITCNGDLWVDDHHTSEDVAIALGQVLNKALGTKAGLNRMWCSMGRYGDAEVEVTMDLSNRPCLTHNLSLSSHPTNAEYINDMSIEMFEHVLDSLVLNGLMTVHIVEKQMGSTIMDTVMATARAFGKALGLCAAVDIRRAGLTASSKGTLSV